MKKAPLPIPKPYHTVTPYLVAREAIRAIDWYKDILAARELLRLPAPGGKIGHAELLIGNSVVMLADEHPEIGAHSPEHFSGSPVGFLVYVDDVDQVVERALAAGATLEQPVQDKFYGDRMGGIRDPWGHRWYVATHVEDVPPDEIERRAAAM